MIFKQINRLQQIDQLIRQKRTGNAEEFAAKLQISRRQVYNWIDEMRGLGLEINYDRDIRSFVYLKPYRISIALDIKELPDSEIFDIEAGMNFSKKCILCNDIAQTRYIFELAN